jgi:hypothetical protein
MPKRPWFRFYVEAASDRKLRKLDPAHRWLWVAVLCAAGSSPIPGELLLTDHQPLDAEDIADIAALPLPTVEAGLAALVSAGLLVKDDTLGCLTVAQWSARQFESDTSTERSRRSRERARSDGATLQERSSNGPESESDTETDPSSSSVLPVDSAAAQVLDEIATMRTVAAEAAGNIRTSSKRFRDRTRENLAGESEVVAKVQDGLERFDEPPAVIAAWVQGTRDSRYLKRRAS